MIPFLATAVVISLSGVMAPGPMTAAALAAGARSRHAGAIMAFGHAAIEFPLMLLIVLGAGAFFEAAGVKRAIGLAGGACLLFLGARLLKAGRKPVEAGEAKNHRHPFLAGVVLTAANPYFLIWWATVGLALTARAVEFGILAFALFALVHWLCDLVWLEALSLASHKGAQLLGPRSQQIVLIVCGLLLLGFGGWFIYDAALPHPPLTNRG